MLVYFDIGSYYVVLSGLKLAMYSKMASNLERSTRLCLPSVGIKSESHCTRLNAFYKGMIFEESFHQTRLTLLQSSSYLECCLQEPEGGWGLSPLELMQIYWDFNSQQHWDFRKILLASATNIVLKNYSNSCSFQQAILAQNSRTLPHRNSLACGYVCAL